MITVLAEGPAVSRCRLPKEIAHKGNLSGATSGTVGRAFRSSPLAGSRTTEGRARRRSRVLPSTQTLGREAQELAAINSAPRFSCRRKLDKLDKLGGREKLQERLTAIKQILEGQ
jgi:hypothetical protein